MRNVIAALLLGVVPLALAADVKQAAGSQGAFVGAVSGALDNPVGVAQWLPGYGLHVAARPLIGDGVPLAEAVSRLRALLPALAGTIKGLASGGDWVSVGYKTDAYELVVRARPADLATVEVWVDGRQP